MCLRAIKKGDDFKRFVIGKRYYISVGRLDDAKRHKEMIKQFKVYHDNDPEGNKLVIIGDGPLKEQLNNLFTELKMNDYIKLFPYSDNPFKYIKDAEAFIFTSYYEGMPNVLLEAMTLGVPIISSDCKSGPRELLDDNMDYIKRVIGMRLCKRGILVSNDFEKENEIAKAIVWLRNHTVERAEIIKHELEYIKRYSNDEITDSWIRLIEKTKTSYKRMDHQYGLELQNFEYIYIYGAGKIGRRMYSEYSSRYKIAAFVCSDSEAMHKSIDGVKVLNIDEICTDNEKTIFIIEVNERAMDAVRGNIEQAGYTHYYIPF